MARVRFRCVTVPRSNLRQRIVSRHIKLQRTKKPVFKVHGAETLRLRCLWAGKGKPTTTASDIHLGGTTTGRAVLFGFLLHIGRQFLQLASFTSELIARNCPT